MPKPRAINRRDFVKSSTAIVGLAAALPSTVAAPHVRRRQAVKPVVIADISGLQFRNGGSMSAVEKAYDLMMKGADVLGAIVAGVNIPELDPLETGIGYGGLPNADGVVQLDASCMHGPRRRAG